jgi:hypothetical protein
VTQELPLWWIRLDCRLLRAVLATTRSRLRPELSQAQESGAPHSDKRCADGGRADHSAALSYGLFRNET